MEKDKQLLLFSLLGAGAFLVTKKIVKKVQAYDYRSKIVLITGGSRGLGYKIAERLSKLGAKVIICGRDGESLKKAKESLSKNHKEVEAYVCDITQRTQVDEMLQDIFKAHNSIDVLVNNAGTLSVGPLESMSYDQYDDAFATHFWAPLHTTMAVLPKMKARKEGRIINISSLAGKISIPHLVPYSTSKFALAGFSEGLHNELKKDNILVTTAYPGLFNDRSYLNATYKGEETEEFKWYSEAQTLPLLSSTTDYVAKEIISAAAKGESEVVVGLPAKILVALKGVFPEITTDLFSFLNEFLPDKLQQEGGTITGNHAKILNENGKHQ